MNTEHSGEKSGIGVRETAHTTNLLFLEASTMATNGTFMPIMTLK
jgi:hypothetical protein